MEYDWNWFHNKMNACAYNAIADCPDLVPIIARFDKIVKRLANRKVKQDRPQDYVAIILVVRAFRAAIGGIELSLAGYADLAPNLSRTIYEISLRLMHINKEPIKLTFAFLIHMKYKEMKALGTEVDYRIEKGISLENMDKSLELIKKQYKALCDKAASEGYNPNKIALNYGKVKIAHIAEMFDIRKSYEVNYSSSSRRLHGLDLLYPPYMVNDGDRSDIHIEPIYSDDCIAGVADILTNLILVIDAGVIILGDESLLEEGRVLLREFYSIKQKIHDKISVDL